MVRVSAKNLNATASWCCHPRGVPLAERELARVACDPTSNGSKHAKERGVRLPRREVVTVEDEYETRPSMSSTPGGAKTRTAPPAAPSAPAVAPPAGVGRKPPCPAN